MPTAGITAKPGRTDKSFVRTNDDGLVEEILLNGLGVSGHGVNQSAETRFENLIRICNQGSRSAIDELYLVLR